MPKAESLLIGFLWKRIGLCSPLNSRINVAWRKAKTFWSVLRNKGLKQEMGSAAALVVIRCFVIRKSGSRFESRD